MAGKVLTVKETGERMERELKARDEQTKQRREQNKVSRDQLSKKTQAQDAARVELRKERRGRTTSRDVRTESIGKKVRQFAGRAIGSMAIKSALKPDRMASINAALQKKVQKNAKKRTSLRKRIKDNPVLNTVRQYSLEKRKESIAARKREGKEPLPVMSPKYVKIRPLRGHQVVSEGKPPEPYQNYKKRMSETKTVPQLLVEKRRRAKRIKMKLGGSRSDRSTIRSRARNN